MELNKYNRKQTYYLTIDGDMVIRAFNQHYSIIFDKVLEEIGKFPSSFTSFY